MRSAVVSAPGKKSRACYANLGRCGASSITSCQSTSPSRSTKKGRRIAGRKDFGQFGLPKPLRGRHYPMRQSILRNHISSHLAGGFFEAGMWNFLDDEHRHGPIWTPFYRSQEGWSGSWTTGECGAVCGGYMNASSGGSKCGSRSPTSAAMNDLSMLTGLGTGGWKAIKITSFLSRREHRLRDPIYARRDCRIGPRL